MAKDQELPDELRAASPGSAGGCAAASPSSTRSTRAFAIARRGSGGRVETPQGPGVVTGYKPLEDPAPSTSRAGRGVDIATDDCREVA